MIDLWELATQEEAGVPLPKGFATFAALPLKGGGVTTVQDLWKVGPQYPTTAWLRALTGTYNGIPVDNPGLWSWAVHNGSIGVNPYGLVSGHVKWSIMVCASPNPEYYTQRQRVAVNGYDGNYAHLAGIPERNDYSALTLDFILSNGYAGVAYTIAPNGRQGLVNGKLFCIPYFSGGFNTSAGFDGELYINRSMLKNKIGQAEPLPLDIALYKVTALWGLRLHNAPALNALVIETMGLGRVVKFVTGTSDGVWYQVQAPDGKIGWAASQYLEPQ